jgi:hypothetical protein
LSPWKSNRMTFRSTRSPHHVNQSPTFWTKPRWFDIADDHFIHWMSLLLVLPSIIQSLHHHHSRYAILQSSFTDFSARAISFATFQDDQHQLLLGTLEIAYSTFGFCLTWSEVFAQGTTEQSSLSTALSPFRVVSSTTTRHSKEEHFWLSILICPFHIPKSPVILPRIMRVDHGQCLISTQKALFLIL